MSDGPRLLMLVERFPPDIGGLARSAARLAGALSRVDVEVDVLAWTKLLPPGTLDTVDAREHDASADGVRLHRLGLFSNLDFSLQHTMNVLEWLHETRRFDAVWGHYLYPAGFMATLFAESAGLPVTVSARGNDIDRLMFPPGDFARLTWTLDRASLVSAVSHDLARKIDVLLGREREVLVLRNCVDTEIFAPGEPEPALREELGIQRDEAVLCFAGELRQKKGFPFLIECLRVVRAARPACLLVVGEVRARERSLLAGFASEHPEDSHRILVTGRLDEPREVARHVRLADIFLHPSVWDGMPNAVLEAMACERICLTSDAGGLPEIIEHDRNGFMLGKAELHRLGEAALEVLSLSAERRAEIGRAARARIESEFRSDGEEESLRRLLARLGVPFVMNREPLRTDRRAPAARAPR